MDTSEQNSEYINSLFLRCKPKQPVSRQIAQQLNQQTQLSI